MRTFRSSLIWVCIICSVCLSEDMVSTLKDSKHHNKRNLYFLNTLKSGTTIDNLLVYYTFCESDLPLDMFFHHTEACNR